MATKLSWQQAEMLILIGEKSVIAEDVVDEKSAPFWAPPMNHYSTAYSETLGRWLYIQGAASVSTMRSLGRRGLIRFLDGYENLYWCRITEEGRMLIESWRESGNWPVEARI